MQEGTQTSVKKTALGGEEPASEAISEHPSRLCGGCRKLVASGAS